MAAGGSILKTGDTVNAPHHNQTLGLKFSMGFGRDKSSLTIPLYSSLPPPDLSPVLVGLASAADFQIHVDFSSIPL